MSLKIPHMDVGAENAAIAPALESAMREVMAGSAFVLGPHVEAFEKEFAALCGAPHGIGCNNGTSALHLAMLLANVGPGDEVITTPYTFASTSWCISYVGAKPVYADIDPVTFNLNTKAAAAVVTPRTKAILPVHLYGQPCDLDALGALAKKCGAALIPDAAQAHGARWKGKPICDWGLVSTFSFYPTKNLGACGEGGALITHDDAIADRARRLRNHGSRERYYHDEVGYNYRLEGIQGAVLRVKLAHFVERTRRRRERAQRYHQLLADTPLALPHEAEGAESVYHLYVIRHAQRDALAEFLLARGIGSAKHYPLPLHLQKCYAGLGYKEGAFPVAEAAARECLALPLYAEMTDAQLETVAAAIREFFSTKR